AGAASRLMPGEPVPESACGTVVLSVLVASPAVVGVPRFAMRNPAWSRFLCATSLAMMVLLFGFGSGVEDEGEVAEDGGVGAVALACDLDEGRGIAWARERCGVGVDGDVARSVGLEGEQQGSVGLVGRAACA